MYIVDNPIVIQIPVAIVRPYVHQQHNDDESDESDDDDDNNDDSADADVSMSQSDNDVNDNDDDDNENNGNNYYEQLIQQIVVVLTNIKDMIEQLINNLT